MGLNELEKLLIPKVSNCRIAQIHDILDAKDKAILTKVLNAKSEHSKFLNEITLHLREAGHEIGDGKVSLHRKGQCACGVAL